MHKSLHMRDGKDKSFICQEKEEEDSPALKIESMHQFNVSWSTIERAKKNWLKSQKQQHENK